MTDKDDRPTAKEIYETMQGLLYGKKIWLDSFSDGPKKRPDHEIEQKRLEYFVLQYVVESYEGRFGGEA